MALKRGIDKAVEAVIEEIKNLQADLGQEGDRPGRHHLANNDSRSGP